MTDSRYPKLRWPLELQHVEDQGKPVTIIRDPLLLCEEPIVLPRPLISIIAHFDGTYSIEQIANLGASVGLTTAFVKKLADDLDRLCLLESNNAKVKKEKLQADYLAAPFRQAAFAGTIYPAQADRLQNTLNEYLLQTKSVTLNQTESTSLIAAMSPHIDYHRGWKTYATTFNALKNTVLPETVFILGTSHQPGDAVFQLTSKDFSCPLGNFSIESKIVNRISAHCNAKRLFSDELLHRREHSIELQLPFLAHLYQQKKASFPKIVPVLVGSFHAFVTSKQTPRISNEVDDFINAAAEALAAYEKAGLRFLLLASVDLSHMGQYFGDDHPITATDLALIEKRDQELLDKILVADEEGLFQHIAEDHDRRRVCGYPSLYTMLAIKKRLGLKLNGKLFEYRQAFDKQNDCMVSFAAAAWFRQDTQA